MNQETPGLSINCPAPFDGDRNFDAQKAIDLARAHRAVGDLDSAEALDLLVDFFLTSRNYIFNGVISFEQEIALGITPVNSTGASI